MHQVKCDKAGFCFSCSAYTDTSGTDGGRGASRDCIKHECQFDQNSNRCVNNPSASDTWSMNDGLGLVFLIVGIVVLAILFGILYWKKCYTGGRHRRRNYSDDWSFDSSRTGSWSEDPRSSFSRSGSRSRSRSRSSRRSSRSRSKSRSRSRSRSRRY